MRSSETETVAPGLAVDPDRARVLVIGYGSPLRSDDAVGLRAAEIIETWALPGVTTITAHGLTPDIAALLAEADRVIFIDARIDDLDDGVIVRPIAPIDSLDRLGHTSDPRQLLALTRIVFGREPEALLITIPAFQTEIGEDFSPATERWLERALGEVASLLKHRI